MDEKLVQRRQTFKKAQASITESRRQREESTVQIRKKEREEQLTQRRRQADLLEPGVSVDFLEKYAHSFLNYFPSASSFAGLQNLRKISALTFEPPLGRLLAVPGLLEGLRVVLSEGHAEFLLEAIWVVTNLASGGAAETNTLMERGFMEILSGLVQIDAISVVEQCIWALANLAGESVANRDRAISLGLVEIIDNLARNKFPNILHTATWALSNLTRGRPSVNTTVATKALNFFSAVLRTEFSVTLVSDALWGVSYISENPEMLEICVNQFPVIPSKTVELLTHHSPNISVPALRVVGNFSAGCHVACLAVIDAVASLPRFFNSPRRAKEALWILSNFLADSIEVSERVVSLNILNQVFPLIGLARSDVKHEIAWCISNLIDFFQARTFENPDLFINTFTALADLLASSISDIRVALVSLQTLLKALSLADARGLRPAALAAFGESGTQALDDLQMHENDQIYKAALAFAQLIKFDS